MPRAIRPGLPLARFDQRVLGEAPGIVGVDEAGRGAWAGPVTAAAVRVEAAAYASRTFRQALAEANDSKRIDPDVRQALFDTLQRLAAEGTLAIAVGWASCIEITRHNILGATALAMRRAVEALGPCPLRTADALPLFEPNPDATAYRLHLDGLPLRRLPWEHQAYVQGDSRSLAIALASIVAKVSRDRHMKALETRYPGYAFARNKAYPTPAHREGLRQLGPCPEHRPQFLRKFFQREGQPPGQAERSTAGAD